MDGLNEQVKKKQKLDLEAITQHDGILYLFPSGSQHNRVTQFTVDPNDKFLTLKNNIGELYTRLREAFNISEEDFNIEGAVFDRDTLLLFNRGNGPNEMNGIIRVFEKESNIPPSFAPIKLPQINGNSAGFTDAALVNGKIFFLAAAEAGKSSFDDGEIGGSQVGVIDLANLKKQFLQISNLRE